MTMKKYFVVLILGAFLTFARPADALIVDLPDMGSTGFFKDLTTGYIWMDIDNFFGQTYSSISSSLSGSDFHLASLSEINQLKLSAPAELALFDAHSAIMGGSTSVNLIWGFFDDDGNHTNGGSWNYKWGLNNFNQATDQWFTPIGSGTNDVPSQRRS